MDLKEVSSAIFEFFENKGISQEDIAVSREYEGYVTVEVVSRRQKFNLQIENIAEFGINYAIDSLDAMWEDYLAEGGDFNGNP